MTQKTTTAPRPPGLVGSLRPSCQGPASTTSALFALDPEGLPGNIEGFAGVAQVPIGLAGPVLVDGEHAKGEFLVPLATTEGTLVASYSRGMKLLREAGGVNGDRGRRRHAASTGIHI